MRPARLPWSRSDPGTLTIPTSTRKGGVLDIWKDWKRAYFATFRAAVASHPPAESDISDGFLGARHSRMKMFYIHLLKEGLLYSFTEEETQEQRPSYSPSSV